VGEWGEWGCRGAIQSNSSGSESKRIIEGVLEERKRESNSNIK
jgi:hypothetical protein